MTEKGTMEATFEPTLDVWRLLEGKPTEYIVVNPVTIEARLKSGEVRRYPQEIRERVTRCRYCRYHAGTFCKLHEVMMPDPSEDDGFCAWGSPREEGK